MNKFNESVLQRITSVWTENTVNWSNQPSTDTSGQAILSESTSGTQDYTNMDVTQMVQEMTSSPTANFGMELKLTNETFYAQMLFASGDNPNADKHPVPEVCYTTGIGIDQSASGYNVQVFSHPAHDILII
ncbi:MAG: DNRLRE domain-containing protein [Bacteroidetes bacterium]|nr:DNRLRE domain-containing protein [Bacteroidota bacterium]